MLLQDFDSIKLLKNLPNLILKLSILFYEVGRSVIDQTLLRSKDINADTVILRLTLVAPIICYTKHRTKSYSAIFVSPSYTIFFPILEVIHNQCYQNKKDKITFRH